MDKPFYGKGSQFHYYSYESRRRLEEPPPHPSHLPIRIGTLFIHRNPQSRETRSWRREASDDGQERWIAIQHSDQRVFDHGTYHYTLTKKGVPSWILAETLRKRKYHHKGHPPQGQEHAGESSRARSSRGGPAAANPVASSESGP